MRDEQDTPKLDPDEPVKIDLDPELALRALLKVDPEAPVVQDESVKDQGDALSGG